MVLVHLAEGFEEVEALMVVDVLRRAEIQVNMVSLIDKLQVKGAHGIVVQADKVFEDVDYEHAEMLVLPGGMPGTSNLNLHSGLKHQLTNFVHQNKWIAAICAAPMVLGDMKLLKGQTAVCYPGFEMHLKGARLVDQAYVVSGQFITGQGVGVADKFALAIVKVLKGEKLATQLAEKMLIHDFS